jgi:DNA-directed RNA polymerase subunit H
MKKADEKGHILVPEHEKLNEKEKEELLALYDISLAELPRIRKSDAALAGMNVKSGDVIKITRNSPTAGIAIFYRVVSGA